MRAGGWGCPCLGPWRCLRLVAGIGDRMLVGPEGPRSLARGTLLLPRRCSHDQRMLEGGSGVSGGMAERGPVQGEQGRGGRQAKPWAGEGRVRGRGKQRGRERGRE